MSIRKTSLSLGSSAKSVLGALLIPVQLVRINRIVAGKEIDDSDFQALTHTTLRGLLEAEQIRAKEIDDKLQKLTAALSVSVTIGGLVGTTMLQNLSVLWAKYVAGGLFLVATIYLLIGALIGFSGLIPKPRYGHGAAFLRISKGRSANAKKELVAAGAAFQRDNLIRTNQAFAATASIRNGVVAFAIGLLVAMFAWATSQQLKPHNEKALATPSKLMADKHQPDAQKLKPASEATSIKNIK